MNCPDNTYIKEIKVNLGNLNDKLDRYGFSTYLNKKVVGILEIYAEDLSDFIDDIKNNPEFVECRSFDAIQDPNYSLTIILSFTCKNKGINRPIDVILFWSYDDRSYVDMVGYNNYELPTPTSIDQWGDDTSEIAAKLILDLLNHTTVGMKAGEDAIINPDMTKEALRTYFNSRYINLVDVFLAIDSQLQARLDMRNSRVVVSRIEDPEVRDAFPKNTSKRQELLLAIVRRLPEWVDSDDQEVNYQ